MSLKRRRQIQAGMFGLLGALSVLVLLVLGGIIGYLVWQGASALSWSFLVEYPTDGMTAGGIFPAIVGTLLLTLGSMLVAFPLGLAAGVFLAEYAHDGWLKRFLLMMTNNLAGIPSIVFGLFGMSFFVVALGMGASLAAGSLTLALMILPVIIRTSEEALRSVPDDVRQVTTSLGATKIQTTGMVVRIGFPKILTGLILAIGRVSGETAPILFTVAAYFITRLPNSVFDQVMALPYHLYVLATSGQDIEKQRPIAYGTALVLLILVVGLNLLANWLRKRLGKKYRMR